MGEAAERIDQLAPGIYDGISHDVYHSLPYASNSYLGRLDRCPAATQLEDEEETKALIFGRALHAYVLEGEIGFYAQFCTIPADAPKKPTKAQIEAKKPSDDTKRAIEWWSEFNRRNCHLTILPASDLETIKGMASAISNHPDAHKLLKTGRSEQTVIWRDRETGLMLRARPDKIPAGNKGVVPDLKSCADAGEKAFIGACIKYGHIREAAIYTEGLRENGVQVDFFPFIAVEKKPPYRTEVYFVDCSEEARNDPDSFISWGHREFRRLLNIEVQCREKQQYPHYVNEKPVELLKPAWL